MGRALLAYICQRIVGQTVPQIPPSANPKFQWFRTIFSFHDAYLA